MSVPGSLKGGLHPCALTGHVESRTAAGRIWSLLLDPSPASLQKPQRSPVPGGIPPAQHPQCPTRRAGCVSVAFVFQEVMMMPRAALGQQRIGDRGPDMEGRVSAVTTSAIHPGPT